MITKQNIANQLRSFDFKGVPFFDLTSLTASSMHWCQLIENIAAQYRNTEIDMIVGLDARGFFFAGALGYAMKIGVIPVRKKGKLPGKTVSIAYGKEYEGDGDDNLDVFELQNEGDILPGMKILVVDDVLATGGSAGAACRLVEMLGATVVGLAFGIEIPALGGRGKLLRYAITSEISILGDGNAYGNVIYCADVLAIDNDQEPNQLLLIQRFGSMPGIAMPGGKIETGESAAKTSIRELQEETGCDTDNVEYLGTICDLGRDPRGNYVSIVVTAKVNGRDAKGEFVDGQIKTEVRRVLDPKYLSDIGQFAFPDHKSFIADAWPRLQGKEAA